MGQVVHIVGGGLAGMAAAIRLRKYGFYPVILEKNPYLGGRVRSFADSETGDEIDNGQHVILSNCLHVLHYLKELNAEKGIALQPHLRIPFLIKQEREVEKRILSLPSWPYPFHFLGGVRRKGFFSLPEMVALAKLLSLRGKNAREFRSFNAGELLEQWGQKEEIIKKFWEPLLIATLNSRPETIHGELLVRLMQETFLRGGKYIRMGFPVEGLSRIFVQPAEQFFREQRIQVYRRTLIQRIELDRETNAVAALIDQEGNSIPVELVLLAIPIHNLLKILPYRLKELLWGENPLGVNYSPILSIHLWTRKPFTRESHLAITGSWLQWIFNKRVYGGPHVSDFYHYQLTVSAADELTDKVPAFLEKMVIEELNMLFPAFNPEDVVRIKIIKEKFATPVSSLANERWRIGPGTPVRNLYLAGDWTDTGLPYTMESAVFSGFRAAERIIEKNFE